MAEHSDRKAPMKCPFLYTVESAEASKALIHVEPDKAPIFFSPAEVTRCWIAGFTGKTDQSRLALDGPIGRAGELAAGCGPFGSQGLQGEMGLAIPEAHLGGSL